MKMTIKREEKWLIGIATLFFSIMNTLTVVKYYGSFSKLADNYHRLFVNTFHVSGFDPLTYEVLSQWWPAYNVYRHPLLAFFMFPFNQINQGLMALTGMNWAAIITAVILVACSVGSAFLLFRIVRQAAETKVVEAYAITALYFSFAFVMLSCMVPDHFVMSQFALLLTLYVAGKGGSKEHPQPGILRTLALFILTAGISLNNGLKVFLMALLTRRKKFFRPAYLLLAVLLPSALIWGFARWEYRTWVWPKEMARNEIRMKKVKADKAKLIKEIQDTMSVKDSAKVMAIYKKENQRRAEAKYRADHKKIWNRNTGKPIAKGEFMRWTDKTTSRWDVAIENLFGEALLLHQDHALGDVLKDRPLIVHYRNWGNYVCEVLLLLLFLGGVWYGRRSMMMWGAMSMFGMDMALHMGLGFGINEIYIMTAHYMFVLPIAMAFLFNGVPERSRRWLLYGIMALALYCMVWNISIIASCLAI